MASHDSVLTNEISLSFLLNKILRKKLLNNLQLHHVRKKIETGSFNFFLVPVAVLNAVADKIEIWKVSLFSFILPNE